MSEPYATAADILAIGRSLTSQQQENAEVLIEQASAKLRLAAQKYGKDVEVICNGFKTCTSST